MLLYLAHMRGHRKHRMESYRFAITWPPHLEQTQWIQDCTHAEGGKARICFHSSGRCYLVFSGQVAHSWSRISPVSWSEQNTWLMCSYFKAFLHRTDCNMMVFKLRKRKETFKKHDTNQSRLHPKDKSWNSVIATRIRLIVSVVHDTRHQHEPYTFSVDQVAHQVIILVFSVFTTWNLAVSNKKKN